MPLTIVRARVVNNFLIRWALTVLAVMFFVLATPVSYGAAPAIDAETLELQARLPRSDGDERFRILKDLLHPDRNTDSTDLASYLDEAQTMLVSRPDDETKIDVLGRLSWHRARQGDKEIALEFADQAIAMATERGDRAQQGVARYFRAVVFYRQFQVEEAMEEARRSAELLTASDHKREAAKTYTLIGAIHRSQSEYDLALAAHRTVLEIATEIDDDAGMARAANNIGLIYWNIGEYEKARAKFASVLPYYRNHGSTSTLGSLLSNLGLVHIDLGQPELALEYLSESLGLSRESRSPGELARVLSNLAYANNKLGNFDLAMSQLEETMAIREAGQDFWGMSRTLGSMAGIYVKRNDLETAERLYMRALDAAGRANARSEIAEINRALSSLYEAQGRPGFALSALRSAYEIDKLIDAGEVREKLVELETARELAEKELENSQALAAKERELARNKQRQVALGVLSAVLLVFAIQLAFYARSRARTLSSIRSYVTRLEETTTSLTESEQRYRSVFNNAVMPNYLVALDTGTILDANEPAAELSSLTREEIKNITVDALKPEWLRGALDNLAKLSDEALQVSKSWLDHEHERKFSDIWMNPVSVDGRRCALITVHDATEERRNEEERLRIDKLESIGNLAGRIAHDFNNALFAILGHITLARRRLEPGDEAAQLLVEAEQAVDQTSRITANLIAFARGGDPHRELHDIRTLLPEAARFFLSGSGTEVHMEMANDLWPVEIDINQFKQLMHSLILNGKDAMADSGTLRVSARNHIAEKPLSPSTPAGKYIRIDVSDTGVGISNDIRDKVLDPFFTTKLGSEGLGLASAFAIATRHSGWLHFESEQGIGSTFTVYLPAQEVGQRSEQSGESVDPGGREHILVMDDDKMIQQVYRGALSHLGYEVDIVGDGESAVARYEEMLELQEPYDLVIMDLTVPGGMGGKDAMTAIRSMDPDALGVVCSGYSHDPVMSNCADAGFSAALTKPFSLSKLAATLRETLGSVH